MYFCNMMLLYERGEIYGNENLLLQKLGRLLLVNRKNDGVTCYVLNSTDIPISSYHVYKLKEECLTKHKTFTNAFGIGVTDRLLSGEPEVSFQKSIDGSFGIRLESDPIELDKRGGEFYNALEAELLGGAGTGMEHFRTFVEIVEIQNSNPAVKVLIHNNPNAAMKMTGKYDLILNVDRAGCLVNCIPYFWEVYYDTNMAGAAYNPILLRLCKDNLKPVDIS